MSTVASSLAGAGSFGCIAMLECLMRMGWMILNTAMCSSLAGTSSGRYCCLTYDGPDAHETFEGRESLVTSTGLLGES
ncbi:hypothetical protein V6N13_092945 [Hibiscus sabdariffa]